MSAKPFQHTHTPEKLAILARADVERIRSNAARLGRPDLVAMCDADLTDRDSQKVAQNSSAKRGAGTYVAGYHFICERGRGVSQIEKGRFWSGSWVVRESEVQTSLKHGAYLALHETKAESSYLQGTLLDYRRAPRAMVDKNNEGIEFLVEIQDRHFDWAGGGAGEKGYYRAKIPAELGNGA